MRVRAVAVTFMKAGALNLEREGDETTWSQFASRGHLETTDLSSSHAAGYQGCLLNEEHF